MEPSTTSSSENTKPLLRFLLDVYGNRAQTNNKNEEQKQLDLSYYKLSSLDNFKLNRHQIQFLISNGGVKVNGEVVTLFSLPIKIVNVGEQNEEKSEKTIIASIELSPEMIQELKNKIRVWALEKPEGVVSSFAKASSAQTHQPNNKFRETNLLDFLQQHTDLLETVQPESTLATNAEKRRKTKNNNNNNKNSNNNNNQDKNQQHQNPPPCPLFPVGRLDKDSCGLLLLTNCGSLCERLLHPDFHHEKEYYVEIARSKKLELPSKFWQLMREGVSWRTSGDAPSTWATSKPCEVVEVKSENTNENNIAFKIKLTQGLNRQIRNMVEAAGKQILKDAEVKKSIGEEGYYVTHLKRIRVGPVSLENASSSSSSSSTAAVVHEVEGKLKEEFLNWAYGQTTATSDEGRRREREE